MVTKTFAVGDQEITVAYSAYTPVLFGDLFPGRDYFDEVNKCVTGEDVMGPYYRFAYTGAYMAAHGEIPEFAEWLDQFNLVDFVAVLADIWNYMNASNNKTSSKSKKK